MGKTAALLVLLAAVVPAACYSPAFLRGATVGGSASSARTAASCRAQSATASIRMQLAEPEAPVTIPDTFDPSKWGGGGGGGGGLGGSGGGFRVPDTFNPSEYQMEKEEKKGATAVMDRPRVDFGKKYKVLLFNDSKNTREHVIDTLIKVIPGMTADRAKLITSEAHNSGMAVVGIWMFELAEAYSDLLNSAGLKSEVEEE